MAVTTSNFDSISQTGSPVTMCGSMASPTRKAASAASIASAEPVRTGSVCHERLSIVRMVVTTVMERSFDVVTVNINLLPHVDDVNMREYAGRSEERRVGQGSK